MTREEIEKAAKKFAAGEITKSRIERGKRAFMAGADWVLNSLASLPLDKALKEICDYVNDNEKEVTE